MQELSVYRASEDPPSFRTVRPPEEAVARAVNAADQIDASTDPPAWRFHVLGPETAEEIAWLKARSVEAEAGSRSARRVFTRWRKIPGWIAISCRRAEDDRQFEEEYARASNAVQNFVLSLWSEHIDTAWITDDIVENEELYGILDLKAADEVVMGILWYGYRSEENRARRLLSSGRVRNLP